MSQSIFTSILPVAPGQEQLLQNKLLALDYKGGNHNQDILGFRELDMLHYASMFLYSDPQDGWLLVFENNIDGEIPDYNELGRFLQSYVQKPAAAYSGCVGRTRKQILFEAEIHQTVSETLDQLQATDANTAAKAVHEALASDHRFAALAAIPANTPLGSELLQAQSTAGRPTNKAIQNRVSSTINSLKGIWQTTQKAGFVASLKALWALLVFLVLAIWNQLRKEPSAAVDTWQPDPEHLRSQREFEDFEPSNHMVSIVHTYEDNSRRWAKWAAFELLDFFARYRYTYGVLGAIPSIHFAHWSTINDHRRLLFVSNYDGSWESYLDDFTQKAHRGLTVAWAHSKGIPRSKFMLSGGAENGPAFIDWARRSMVPTLVWFNAYPHLSIRNINRNSALRQALAKDHQQNNSSKWLELVQ